MRTILILIHALLFFQLYSQDPANDPHYQLIWQDDFNGNSIDPAIWKIEDWNDGRAAAIYSFPGHSNPDLDDDQRYPSVALATNIDISGGTMKMHYKTDNITCGTTYNAWYNKVINNNAYWWCSYQYEHDVPYLFSGAAIDLASSLEETYGYYEARVKIPYQNTAWAAFWTFRGEGLPVTGVNAGEIDIFETISRINEYPYNTPLVIKTNLHYSYCPQGSCSNNISQGFCNNGVPGGPICSGCPNVPCMDLNVYGYNYTQWHTYGLELTPNKIIWYIDGIRVRSEPNTHIHNQALTLKLGIGAEGTYTNPSMAPFDVTMETDYVRFYKITSSDCNDVVSGCSFYFGGYQNTIKKSITIGTTGCSNIQPVGTSKIFRAKEFVLLNGNFEVPLGSELYIDVNNCY